MVERQAASHAAQQASLSLGEITSQIWLNSTNYFRIFYQSPKGEWAQVVIEHCATLSTLSIPKRKQQCTIFDIHQRCISSDVSRLPVPAANPAVPVVRPSDLFSISADRAVAKIGWKS